MPSNRKHALSRSSRTRPSCRPSVPSVPGSRTRSRVDSRPTVGCPSSRAVWGVMKSFVRIGNGVAVMPSCCVTEEDRLCVVGIGGYPNRPDCGVYLRRLESLSPPVVDFLETLESSRDRF